MVPVKWWAKMKLKSDSRTRPAHAVSMLMNNPNPMSSIPPPHQPNQDGQYLLILRADTGSYISLSTMIPPRLGMSCAGSVAVPTCPVMPILPPHHTRRSQAVQSLSPPVILALSWPQSKIKNSAVVVTTCAVSTSTSKLSENIQFGRCNHPGCMCISLPSQPYYHDVLWWVFGLSVQSWLLTEWGKVRIQDGMNRNTRESS